MKIKTDNPWGHSRPYNVYGNYIKAKYGGRLQKVSIDGGFTCPNRDGTISKQGCFYCNNAGFNPSYCKNQPTISQQINEGILFLEKRYKPKMYLAYFQAYTSTYAPLSELKEKYQEALSHKKINGLVISTRPDCLPDDVIAYLYELSQKYLVFLEIGIESCNDKTLKKINRGHTFNNVVKILEKLKKTNIPVCGHFIVGLPGETQAEMLKIPQIISTLPIQSIKIHQLQILKNTPLVNMYQNNPEQFVLFSYQEYIDFIIQFLAYLPAHILVQRLISESPPYTRIAPDWGGIRMDVVQNVIEQEMIKQKIRQGKFV